MFGRSEALDLHVDRDEHYCLTACKRGAEFFSARIQKNTTVCPSSSLDTRSAESFRRGEGVQC
jgi:hypothetical protein